MIILSALQIKNQKYNTSGLLHRTSLMEKASSEMILQYSPFIIPLLVSAAITCTLALVSLKRRDYPVIPPFILFMGATTWWAFCYAVQLANADLATQILITTIEYPAIATAPVAWLLVALCYTGHEHLVTRWNAAALFLIPAIVIILVATNPYHQLYYTSFTAGTLYGATVWDFAHGPFFWIQAGYGYLCLGLAFILIARRFLTTPAIYRQQIIILVLAAAVPVLANLLYLGRLRPFPGLDTTPFAFTLMGILMAFGIFRFRLFSLMPVAYPVIFSTIDDGIIVLDRNDRISELNPAASAIICNAGWSPIGEPASAVLPSDLVASLACDSPGRGTTSHTVISGKNGQARDYEVTCTPITTPVGGYNGRLLMFRDETEKRKARQAIEMTNRKLNLLSSITRHDMLNKLTALGGYIELAKAEKDEAVVRKYLSVMEKTARVFQQELEFTRDYQDLGMKAPAWQGVAAIIREQESHLPTQDVRIERAIQPAMLEIYADLLLGKVFYNLIENALRYGGNGMTDIRITTRQEGRALVLVFADNGAGIPQKDKERLFNKGFGKNTGLGLFLSREILAITGITIAETGEPGKGARFEITVPEGMYRS
jgi:PAS domain S-box-containing protein